VFKYFLGNGCMSFLEYASPSCTKNAEQGRAGEDISQKDPMEMRMMLQDRLQKVQA
jgi:homoserine kinase type II